MKSLSLTFALTFMLTLSLFAQDQRYYTPVPEAIIGEWKVAKQGVDSKIESISFYASGLLNIDTKGSKMVINYKVAERSEGYEVIISGMEHTSSFSSFFIQSVEENNMQITTKNGNSSRTYTLTKTKDIPYGIIPLKAKNSASL